MTNIEKLKIINVSKEEYEQMQSFDYDEETKAEDNKKGDKNGN